MTIPNNSTINHPKNINKLDSLLEDGDGDRLGEGEGLGESLGDGDGECDGDGKGEGDGDGEGAWPAHVHKF